ncbi:IclR family transcriptional regulator [Salinadaptatus halalkaliphilus]|uniref:IclR family transcriptional regulator n=1 Tax=Salinadaptatus halalkaliphilus TaxID=2419781 RepID=A0A4S3TP81_9EURY|nr:IclR family transcriptional regulator [Salinadaptatus halalkaliphilus]THE66134.1 IclR family transcriptional regulator [Salinadaptatus halalkaliphilus]
MDVSDDSSRVTTVETAFELLETIVRRDGCRITELAEEHDLAKSTVHRHLTTLEELEYVVNDDGIFRTGFRFLKIGERTRARLDEYELVERNVAALADETNECVQFMVEEHGWAVYVFRDRGDNAVATDAEIGDRLPIHACAGGKAILAFSDDDRLEEIIDDRGLPQLTDATITDRDELVEQLAAVRERGYSCNDQESADSLRAFGVPIRYEDGRVLGALSVSGPIRRFQDDSLATRLLETANELELKIRYA